MTRETYDKYKDFGLLILRIGVGLSFMLIHGLGKVTGGPERWKQLGGAMTNIGIPGPPEMWGFLSAAAEFGGGLLILFGLFSRPVAFCLMIDMIVATSTHLLRLDAWVGVSHPMKMAVVFAALIFTGAGRYSLDHLIFRKRSIVVKEVNPQLYQKAG